MLGLLSLKFVLHLDLLQLSLLLDGSQFVYQFLVVAHGFILLNRLELADGRLIVGLWVIVGSWSGLSVVRNLD